MRKWANDSEPELYTVEVSFDGIADRRATETCYRVKGKEVWIDNGQIMFLDEMRGTFELRAEVAEKLGLS